MNIFGVGTFELLIIILIMLLVAGPKRMMQWAVILGRYVGKFRRMWSETVDLLQQELDAADTGIQLPKEVPTRRNVTRWASQAVAPIAEPFESVMKEAAEPLQTVATEINQVTQEIQADVTQISVEPQPEQTTEETADFGTWATSNGETQPDTAETEQERGFGTWAQARKPE